MKLRPVHVLTLLTLAIVILAGGNATWRQTSEPLPVLGQSSGFQLTDQNGRPFTADHLKGKIWVADLIFTSCGGICPVMSRNMAALQRSYNLEDRVEFVSVSVNPDTDTPEILQQYAARFQANSKKWHFLTGNIEAIQRLAVEGFKLGTVENPVFHSAYFVLIDGEGRIRGYYEGTESAGIRKLFRDLAKLLKETHL